MANPAGEIRQADVWRVSFYEGGERPAIVVSRNDLNRGRLLLMVPCTSSRVQERRSLPNHVYLPQGVAGLAAESIAQTHLIQPVEREALSERLGTLPAKEWTEVLLAIAWTTALFEGISTNA
ncbi:MAG: type II toxin-antitoxin system PemK/MazF family toxin [Planctomycetes bacterium]|nr:type II toxin-antitoxin system PemK/MazF family toxin [Planctomycetota bacterium]